MKTKSEDLMILLAVVDAGGFSAAAKQLDIQVTKVSRAVSRVEKALNTTLLNRTTRRVQLSEEGRDFIGHVRLALQSLQQAEEQLLTLDSKPKGKLHIDASSSFLLHQIVPHVAEFSAAFPDIQLEMSSNEGYVDLLEKNIDIAFRIGHLTDSTLHARFMGSSDLYIVGSPAYLSQHGTPINFDELRQHLLIGFSRSKNLNFWPLGDGVQVTPHITTTNGEAIRKLCLQGAGISCLSGFMINNDLQKGNLISLFAKAHILPSDRRNINALYYKTSAISRRISAFLDFIQPRLTL